MCRAAPEPPEICNEPISPFPESEDLTNDGLLRENSTANIVIVGDEGDNSRRMQQGMEDPSPYLDAFAHLIDAFVSSQSVPTTMKPLETSRATQWGRTWMVERLRAASEETKGFFRPLEVKDSEGNCQIADFSGHLEDLGALLNSLETSFQLRSVPDVTTIQVYVDGEEVPASPILNAEEYDLNPDEITPNYGDGWSYSSQKCRCILGYKPFQTTNPMSHYYCPIGGTPRQLPFLTKSFFLFISETIMLSLVLLTQVAQAAETIDIGTLKYRDQASKTSTPRKAKQSMAPSGLMPFDAYTITQIDLTYGQHL